MVTICIIITITITIIIIIIIITILIQFNLLILNLSDILDVLDDATAAAAAFHKTGSTKTT